MGIKLNLNNKLINGNFEYWQRGTSFPAIASAIYSADRWKNFKNGVVTHTISRSSDVPSLSSNLYSLDMTVTTAMTPTGSDISAIFQPIEGNVLRSFKGKKMVLKFWVKSSVVGTYSITLSSASDRQFTKDYSISQANTWELKTVRFQHDSSGTWDYVTGIGMFLLFNLAIGATRKIAPDAWTTTATTSGSVNQVNAVGTIGNIFRLSDIVLVEDNDGATRDPDFQLAGRDIFEELQLCQRYFEKSYALAVNPGTASPSTYEDRVVTPISGNLVGVTASFKVTKRAPPSSALYADNGAIGAVTTQSPAGVVTAARSATISTSHVNGLTVSVGTAATDPRILFSWTADAEL